MVPERPPVARLSVTQLSSPVFTVKADGSASADDDPTPIGQRPGVQDGLTRPVGPRPGQLPGQVEPHGEGHQPLLGAVVDIALQLAALRILRCDESLPRRAEVLDETDVAQNQAGLGGDVVHELPLGLVERVPHASPAEDPAERLAVVRHRHDE